MATTTASVTIRVDEPTKAAASRIAEDFGFDLSSVTRAFYRQMVREQRIPLNLSYPEPNAESLKAVHEADAIIAKGEEGYESAEDMFASMGL